MGLIDLMDIQLIIVVAIVSIAAAYSGIEIFRKTRQFKPDAGCGHDCGCSAPQSKEN